MILKTGIIIQARKGSTRLPNKLVLPFYQDKGILELLIEKLKKKFSTKKIVLATTINPLDDELEIIAKKHHIKCYRGSENNVLQRFIEAADENSFNNIIRICADNPFLDVKHIDRLIYEIENNDIDYVSYKTKNGLPTIKSHLGLYTEGVTLKALKEVKKYTSLPLYIEHVTNYIYEYNEQFNVKLLNLPSYMNYTNSIRLTLDTKNDFELEKELYKKFHSLSTKDLIITIKNNNILIIKMKNQISKNRK